MLDPQYDQRIAVVGPSGAGKTTLAAGLAGELGAEHTPLDDLHFGPNWAPRPAEDFHADIDRITAGVRWVLDGNYAGARHLIWPRATTLVWLDYPLRTCLRRLLPRTLQRVATGELVCNGNRETFRQSFLSTDSVLLWAIRSHRGVRRQVTEDLAKPKHADLRVIHLKKLMEWPS